MHRFYSFTFALLTSLLCASSFAASVKLPDAPDIPFRKHKLKNGLTLIIHEDHKAPVVAVNVWYHVGSKNEKRGRTGFAHLFEHLMFNGSENFNDDFFKALDNVGATGANGTTSEDRTNYFEEAPKNALDYLLWLESDRMGHFANAISQERLDEQRGVVQNEKRQGENQPYGRAYDLITKATYPANHPYSWTVIGEMEDLNAASLADVKEWFATYYGAANAVLVVAGDVETDAVIKTVERHFGDIPSGPPVAKFTEWIAKRTGSQRQIMQDRVPQARLYKVWNVAAYGSEDAALLDLFASLLSYGKNSRLYKRLVYTDQIASEISAYNYSREISGLFGIEATARPGEDLHKVEAALNEEVARLIADGPTKAELERVKMDILSQTIRRSERIGGFGGKADILAESEVFAGDPGFYRTNLARIRAATAKQIQAVAKKWLTDGDYNLEVFPFPEYSTNKSDVDRKKLPALAESPDAKFPDFQRAELDNGLKIIVAERHATPVVSFSLLLDAGFASDTPATAGLAKLTVKMLEEGTKEMSSLEINDRLRQLGAGLQTRADLDFCEVEMTALKANLDESLDVFSDVALRPAFPEKELGRLKKNQLDSISQEKVEPFTMALRVLPKLLYGEGHAYANPLTGSGTDASVKALSRDDVTKFYETWFKPKHATLVIVGDTTLAEIKPKLEKRFASWTKGEIPKKNIAKVDNTRKRAIYLMDRPDSIQTTILAGRLTVPRNNPDEPAILLMNNVLGGDFTSRINMNLREDKHWSYGAGSFVRGARGQRPFIAYAPVQSDKSKESIVEMRKELTELLKDRAIKEEEFAKNKKKEVLELAGRWQTIGAVRGSIAEIVNYALPDDYWQKYGASVKAVDLARVQKAAETVVVPDELTWVIIGDLAKIETGIKELNLGEIRYIDADAKPINRN
jgi:zinc protease